DWYTSDTAGAVLDGTSMAAPVVGGIAALYAGRYPQLSASDVAAAVAQYGSHGRVAAPGTGGANVVGQGIVPPSAPPGPGLTAAGDALTQDVMDAVLGVDPRSANHDPNNYNLHVPAP